MTGSTNIPQAWRDEPLTRFEHRAHSQFGEDGVIQEMVRRIRPPFRTCVEFGAANGTASNTALLVEQGWRALLIESHPELFAALQRRYSENSWAQTRRARVGPDNINGLLAQAGLVGFIGLISIDVDGNDLWIWRGLSVVRPAI